MNEIISTDNTNTPPFLSSSVSAKTCLKINIFFDLSIEVARAHRKNVTKLNIESNRMVLIQFKHIEWRNIENSSESKHEKSNQKPDSFLKTVQKKNQHLIYLFVTIIDCFSSIFIFSSLYLRACVFVSRLLSLCWLRWLTQLRNILFKLNEYWNYPLCVCCSKNKKIMINSLFERQSLIREHPPHFIHFWVKLLRIFRPNSMGMGSYADRLYFFFAALNTVWIS